MAKQTAGRDQLGEFAPQFAALNDDVLFGEVWEREEQLSAHDRSLITCSALLAMGAPQLEAHLNIAKQNGVTEDEIVELITHLAFYAGWPKAWSAFALAKEIFGE
ncbi:carboxymuconolactone decarboxylase family protein [Enterococcus pallens]|uniref:Carboxymuconolactone decarboxylase n=1 Tax=Enterococcus pallens ATCC BAA-351 TaxID=1158607 RepID=R2QM14_9ENTE|nr:carboxymuconolactone decarboxylase family protein [Enterococcus pallens]EOH97607.1 carboxymuconolactone decarboxylase [Enterococcus pallens ATCC BAA-351]EOU20974.1 carboxymuconolactone decarboxylase [Enterococcus pallens ATCC BAA-351]OJG80147.1 carboxymuconolactone decarboxylase [Enterococcus pallens]